MNEFDKLQKLAKRFKSMYPTGTRIELQHMDSDPRPIPDGTRGTVEAVDDLGTIHCKFDNGRRLGIIPGEDKFRLLTHDELRDEMSKMLVEQYIAKVNDEIIPNIEWKEMQRAYDYYDTDYPSELLKQLHSSFVETYGTDEIDSDMGFMLVPGLVKVANGDIYPVLLDIFTVSSGEHWGTTFFTQYGVLSDREDKESSQGQAVWEILRHFLPYQYWYTPKIEGDIHVEWDNCPNDVQSMLKAATEPEMTNEVRLE